MSFKDLASGVSGLEVGEGGVGINGGWGKRHAPLSGDTAPIRHDISSGRGVARRDDTLLAAPPWAPIQQIINADKKRPRRKMRNVSVRRRRHARPNRINLITRSAGTFCTRHGARFCRAGRGCSARAQIENNGPIRYRFSIVRAENSAGVRHYPGIARASHRPGAACGEGGTGSACRIIWQLAFRKFTALPHRAATRNDFFIGTELYHNSIDSGRRRNNARDFITRYELPLIWIWSLTPICELACARAGARAADV
ncbi:hypothetical protein EVAR_285_1 [Eumeta japonica]|uniref:Uncharacterized protein n=1 Tax=Eumeta variegata TaxID=151549 RepID=A0A4C1S9J8_EUMVA|nr:hypothetical protein EVAR_285_1 [Eumeta japonica]